MARVKNADRIEEGGIFALYSKEIRNDLVGLAYYGMYALQHRGQESAGFSIFDTISEDRERQKTVKNKGFTPYSYKTKGLTKVGAKCDCDDASIQSTLKAMKKINSSAWVYESD